MRYLAYNFFLIGNIASTAILLIIPIALTYLIYLWGIQNICKILYFKYCQITAMQIILQTENIPISKSKK